MLFCAKAKRLAADIAMAAWAVATPANTVRRPNIQRFGKITPSGDCGLPPRGEPINADRLPQVSQTRPQ
jgi:hypothetical protein